MKKYVLTPDDKKALKLLHSNIRDGRQRDRIKAVLLYSDGWTVSQIAQALLIHETSVNRFINDYFVKGKLLPENGGSTSLLSAEQTLDVVTYLENIIHHDSRQIATHIESTYHVKFTLSGMNKWLHRVGFSYKKCKGIPHKMDTTKQAEFIEAYESLKLLDEPIYFMDAVHPTQATKLGYGWIKTGVEKFVKTTGSRTRVNIVGAINLNALTEAIIHRYDTVNAESIIDFMARIRNANPLNQRLNLILDGAGYHRATRVKNKADELNIELHYLPPYSPNLNPIERLWKVMNEYARNNKYFATAKEFRQQLDAFFTETLPTLGAVLATRITDDFQVLKTAS